MQPKKVGRPVSANPKDKVVKFLMDRSEWEMLKDCAKRLNTTHSDVIRQGISKIYTDLN